MNREQTFRVAIRKFGPFESAVRKQWDSFRRAEGVTLELDAQAMDLHPLCQTMFEREGLKRGDWDIGFLNTDWMAAARDSGAVFGLADSLRSAPPEAGVPDLPQGSVR